MLLGDTRYDSRSNLSAGLAARYAVIAMNGASTTRSGTQQPALLTFSSSAEPFEGSEYTIETNEDIFPWSVWPEMNAGDYIHQISLAASEASFMLPLASARAAHKINDFRDQDVWTSIEDYRHLKPHPAAASTNCPRVPERKSGASERLPKSVRERIRSTNHTQTINTSDLRTRGSQPRGVTEDHIRAPSVRHSCCSPRKGQNLQEKRRRPPILYTTDLAWKRTLEIEAATRRHSSIEMASYDDYAYESIPELLVMYCCCHNGR